MNVWCDRDAVESSGNGLLACFLVERMEGGERVGEKLYVLI